MNKTLYAALAGMIGMCGCSEVKPWERGVLAKPQMEAATSEVTSEMRRHIYGSREAGAGSAGANGGGGCGCY